MGISTWGKGRENPVSGCEGEVGLEKVEPRTKIGEEGAIAMVGANTT